jgi:hypothetical protein
MEAKVEQHSWIAEMMRQNDLPYDHYYVFNGKPKDAGFKWVVRKWEQIAKALKQQV